MAYSAITNGSEGGEGFSGGRQETSMNKADLVARVTQDADVTKRRAEKVADVLLGSIQTR
jgi:hypothetical protein